MGGGEGAGGSCGRCKGGSMDGSERGGNQLGLR